MSSVLTKTCAVVHICNVLSNGTCLLLIMICVRVAKLGNGFAGDKMLRHR